MNDYIGIIIAGQSVWLSLFITQIGIMRFQQGGDIMGRKFGTHREE